LQDAIAKISKEPSFRQFVISNGNQISPAENVAEFQSFLKESIERESAVMSKLGLKAQT
jgi:hypothetical protein